MDLILTVVLIIFPVFCGAYSCEWPPIGGMYSFILFTMYVSYLNPGSFWGSFRRICKNADKNFFFENHTFENDKILFLADNLPDGYPKCATGDGQGGSEHGQGGQYVDDVHPEGMES